MLLIHSGCSHLESARACINGLEVVCVCSLTIRNRERENEPAVMNAQQKREYGVVVDQNSVAMGTTNVSLVDGKRSL